MKAELTDISGVKKRLDIEIPEDVVAAEMTTIARELAKRARIPGFRPGKAPVSIVKSRYRDDILSEMYQNLLPRYFYDAVQENNLAVVEASTTFEPPDYANGRPLSFQVGFEVFPSFEIGAYSEIPVEDVPTEVGEEEIDAYLANLVEERAEMSPVEEDRPLQTGDFAEITFSGSIVGGGDGEGSGNVSGEKALCEIGGETTVSEFTENLTGAKAGEERSFEVVYGDDHPENRLAGKTVRYDVKIEGVKEKTRPELDDEFSQGLGDYETLEDLRAEVRKNMEGHRKEHADQQVRDGLLRWLEDNNPFEVPDALVEQQVQVRLERLVRNLSRQGINPKRLDIDWMKIREDQYGQAVRDVRGLLILERLADQENVTVTDEDIAAEIEKMADEMNQPAAKVREALSGNDGLDRMRGQIRNEKVLKLLEGHAKRVPPGSLADGARKPDDKTSLAEPGAGE